MNSGVGQVRDRDVITVPLACEQIVGLLVGYE